MGTPTSGWPSIRCQDRVVDARLVSWARHGDVARTGSFGIVAARGPAATDFIVELSAAPQPAAVSSLNPNFPLPQAIRLVTVSFRSPGRRLRGRRIRGTDLTAGLPITPPRRQLNSMNPLSSASAHCVAQ